MSCPERRLLAGSREKIVFPYFPVSPNLPCSPSPLDRSVFGLRQKKRFVRMRWNSGIKEEDYNGCGYMEILSDERGLKVSPASKTEPLYRIRSDEVKLFGENIQKGSDIRSLRGPIQFRSKYGKDGFGRGILGRGNGMISRPEKANHHISAYARIPLTHMNRSHGDLPRVADQGGHTPRSRQK